MVRKVSQWSLLKTHSLLTLTSLSLSSHSASEKCLLDMIINSLANKRGDG